MASLTYRQLRKLLKSNGCVLVRQAKGSHEVWQTKDGVKFTVPVSLKGEGTLSNVLKIAGIKR